MVVSPEQARVPSDSRATFGPRVLLADSHRTFTEVLAARLEMEPRFPTVDVAFSVPHASRLLAARRYDVLMLDPSPDIEASLRLLQAVLCARPSLIVVVVSELDDVQRVIDVLERGVRAWVSKDTPFDGLLHALDQALSGDYALSTSLLGPVLKELLGRPARGQHTGSFLDDLTPRQLEVLQCLSIGMSRSEIAEKLLLSPNTVRTHVQEVLRKAGVHSTLAAIAKAREAGYRRGAPWTSDEAPSGSAYPDAF